MADRLLGKRVLVTQARAQNYVENREYYPPELMQKDSFVASLKQGSMLPEWALKSAVARLATVDGERPHLVPVVFCELDGALFIPVDGKPKSGTRLRRLRNIERNPAVTLLIDRYSDDWSDLCWTRIDGRAEIVATDHAVRDALETKYPQYEQVEIGTTAIRVTIERIASWSAKGQRRSGSTVL